MGVAISPPPTDFTVSSKTTSCVTRSQVSEFPSLRPTIYLVGDIGDVLRVVQPIELTWAVDEFRQNVISDDVSFMYGVGDTVELAMADYKASLIDYYLTLSSRQDAPTRKLFDRLCKYILFK